MSNVSSIRTILKAIIAVSFLINSLFLLLGIVKNEKDITSNYLDINSKIIHVTFYRLIPLEINDFMLPSLNMERSG